MCLFDFQSSNYDGSNLDRCLLEGLSTCFLTELDRSSYEIVLLLIFRATFEEVGGGAKQKKNAKSKKLAAAAALPFQHHQPLKLPPRLKGVRAVQIEGYWLQCGEGNINVQASTISL